MLHRFRQVPLIATLAVAILAMFALGFALVWRAEDLARQRELAETTCQALEAHKAVHRGDAAFNLEDMKAILLELGIDPESERGIRLIERSQRNAVAQQARFAARPC